MQQIITNPSKQRSVTSLVINKTELVEYLKITFNDSSAISIFPNMEYNFIFYNSITGDVDRLTALVTKVYEDQIRVKYSTTSTEVIKDCSKCSNSSCSNKNKPNISKQAPMPTCNCVLNPPDTSKYEEPRIYFIPIHNLIDVSYVLNSSGDSNNQNNRDEVKVMLLGISATMVKAIVVRLQFFEDSIEDAIKYVDLKAGGIYDISYEEKDGTIFESRVKIKEIEEVGDGKYDSCKPGKGFVREHVGSNNFIYTTCSCSKADFMQSPPVKRVKIIVDTSETFEGRYECIMLDSIRDCKLVDGSNFDKDFIESECCCDGCEFKTHTCTPETCHHYIPPKKENCSCSPKEYTYRMDKN